jgi:poly [ADP-ribose] polymerase
LFQESDQLQPSAFTKKKDELAREYQELIPSKQQESFSRNFIAKQMEFLQSVKDLLSTNEIADEDSDVFAKYKALHAQVVKLEENSTEFSNISRYVIDSQYSDAPKKIQIHTIYSVKRHEEKPFKTNQPPNSKLLFHGSKYENFLGILSRGLLVPKMVTSLGTNRTDAGLLGAGIYFSDSISASLKYSLPSKHGKRLALIAQVELGTIQDYFEMMPDLVKPPDGFDSVHVRNILEFSWILGNKNVGCTSY